jgi:ABC-type antimicrobial peptide transport system permease subunit
MRDEDVKIPFSYIFRNLWTRKITTLLTASGMALVVFVFAAVLMLDAGLKKTLVSTGSFDNAILLRQSSQTEIQSSVYRDQASLIETIPEVARSIDGAPLVSKEILVLTQIPKRGSDRPQNIVVRGLSPMGVQLRPQVKIIDGRMFRPGTSEIIVGKGVSDGFEGVAIGQLQRFAGREWTVVGTFDGGKSGFDSEIWGDVEQMMQAFRRVTYSSVIARLRDPSRFADLQKRISDDQRLILDVKQEPVFYEEQSRTLSQFISILGITLSVIFSIGAMIGAMITMYAAVANRTGEIGTLRALGFRRSSILAAFLIESILLAIVGGIMGLTLASFLQAFTITTMNWQSFSQLAFGFYLTPRIVVITLIFSVFMGFVGGFLPSVRAARLEIVDSLRAA